MNLNDIIIAALDRLDRGSDTQMIDHYRPAYTNYANSAVKMIANRYREIRKDDLEVQEDVKISLDDLPRYCEKVVKVIKDGKPLKWVMDEVGSGELYFNPAFVSVGDTVTVYYRFTPKELTSYTDVPEIPLQYHSMIPYYIVAMDKQGSDPSTYYTATPEWQLFSQMLAEVKSPYKGHPAQYRLRNYY